MWFLITFLVFSPRSCLSISLITKFHHLINKNSIVSPWSYSRKLCHLRYINLVWVKHWHLIKILFCAWKSSAQNRNFHTIVVICSLRHAITHIQITFLVSPVSLNYIYFFYSHRKNLVLQQVRVTDKLKLLESQN